MKDYCSNNIIRNKQINVILKNNIKEQNNIK